MNPRKLNVTPVDEEAQHRCEELMEWVVRRSPHQPEFHQAVGEVIRSIMPFVVEHPKYLRLAILKRLVEPDRTISFRVCWVDDSGCAHVNRGWRVQFSNALGPYKGGLRFHPTVYEGLLKFLGFEQVLKNSLTGLPLGGAKGGADFDPKGKSDAEIMRFCYFFMVELARVIGADRDIPAGDIGVGHREIGYLFGAYKKLSNRWTGVVTGKALEYGGSLVRKESTGYGCVYFCRSMLARDGQGIHGKTCLVSGAGNVALYTAEKLIELGGRVVSMSDSSGCIHDPDGIDQAKLEFLKDLKEVRRGRIGEYAEQYPGTDYYEGKRPWFIACDLAFPCATQNEISQEDAALLIENGVSLVCEGANMPSTPAAIAAFARGGVLFAPGKAANAGGVAVSGIEMSQNALRLPWDRDRVDAALQRIMNTIHEKCVRYGERDGRIDYVRGANIAGFVRAADTMLDYGIV